jgi:hypothetical protein
VISPEILCSCKFKGRNIDKRAVNVKYATQVSKNSNLSWHHIPNIRPGNGTIFSRGTAADFFPMAKNASSRGGIDNF